jgi:hypothetical protein
VTELTVNKRNFYNKIRSNNRIYLDILCTELLMYITEHFDIHKSTNYTCFFITGKNKIFLYSFPTSKDCTESRIIILFRLSFSAIGQFSSVSVHPSESCHTSMDAGKISEDLQAISGFRNYLQDHWLLLVRINTFER